MQPKLMEISKNKKGHFLDFGRKMVSTEGTLKRFVARLQIFAVHSLGNTGLGVQKTFHKILRGASAKKVKKH